MPIFELKSANVALAVWSDDEAHLALEYITANRVHLEPWEPLHDENFYTLEATRSRVRSAAAAFSAGTAYNFAILDDQTGKMIGVCGFSNVARGVFQACHLGYSISETCQGRGLMFEALETAVKYMFDEVDLHRVMANHMPSNQSSAKLLKRLGF
ncbi:MAG: GNAT family N-acetyltransferase [Candidatus Zixiibacteriota bacterium]